LSVWATVIPSVSQALSAANLEAILSAHDETYCPAEPPACRETVIAAHKATVGTT